MTYHYNEKHFIKYSERTFPQICYFNRNYVQTMSRIEFLKLSNNIQSKINFVEKLSIKILENDKKK